MKYIDIILLTGIFTLASCMILIPKRIHGILKPFIAFVLLLTLVQYFAQGFYWQYLTSYLLIFLVVLIAIFSKDDISKIIKRLLQFFLVVMLLLSFLPWSLFLPVPELTKPHGEYKLGTRIFRWTDSSRAEEITPEPHDKRNVVAQAWYPTEQDATGAHSSYLDGMDNLPKKIGVIPGFIFIHYDHIETYGILNAPLSNAQNQWPVILFLTGNGASRAFYTGIATGLASHGYVVLTIDHPYEASFTQLANSKVVTTTEIPVNDDPDLTKFMKVRLDLRVSDIQFVINQLGNPKGSTDNFLLSLDLNRIGIAGHSLGGASAGVAMACDSRIKAAANIDGTLYGELPKPYGPRPFLLLESNKDDSGRYLRYEAGNQLFFKQFGGGHRYEIINADHISFTDVPLLLAFPARFLASHIFKFGNIPTRTHIATVDILHTFFYGALNDKLSEIDSITARHQGIIRKPLH